MNKKFKKIIAIGLSVLTISNCAIPAMAATSYKDSTASVIEDINGTDIQGNDTVQKEKTQYSEYSEDKTVTTDVYVTQKSTFSVIVPLVAVLNGKAGEANTGNVRYKAFGNIASDEIISVTPDETFKLHQEGKDDIDCTISEKDTIVDFSYANGIRPDNALTRDYTITAHNMTAGSWHGSYNTNISLIPHYRYYTSFENAIADLNSGGYDTADLYTAEPENALCALYFGETTNEIVMFKDAENVNSVTVEKNLRLDLRGHTITFADGKYLTYNSNLRVENGTINTVDSNYTISGPSTNTSSTLSLRNLSLNETVTENISTNAIQINSYSLNNNFDDLRLNLTGNSNYGVVEVVIRNVNSTNEINNCTFKIDVNSQKARATQVAGSTIINNPVVDILNNSLTYGLTTPSTGSNKTVINNAIVKIVSTSSSESSRGISIYSNVAEINGADVYVDTPNSGAEKGGMGILFYTTENATINSTDQNPVTVFGKQWGIQTSPDGTTTINGGTYTATNHTGYILGNADIYNAKFYITNRENYTIKDNAWGFYCGSPYESTKDCVVNLYNCELGNKENINGNAPAFAITAKNNGYYAPKEINLNDCILYQGTWYTFNYNYTTTSNKAYTKFNLYGNTKLYKYNSGVEFTKDEVLTAIDTWKDNVFYGVNSGDTMQGTIYDENKIIGGDFYCNGTDETPVEEAYEDYANVYDYRP